MALQSSQRLPELLFYTKKSYRFFSSNSSSNSTRVPIQHTSSIHPHTTYTCTITLQYIQRILHPESNSTCRRQRALRVLLHTEGKRTFISERNSTHRRQGDLLEIHPCVLQDNPGIPATRPSKGTPVTTDIPVFPDIQDIPVFPVFPDIPVIPDILDIPVIHNLPAFPGNSTSSSISRESTPFRHSPIRMHTLQFLQFNWFPQKTSPSTSWTIQTTNIHSSKKGRCCNIGQN